MKWYKIFGISKRIILTITRDAKFLFISILAPIVILLVFSIIYKPQIGIINIGIVNLEKNPIEQLNIPELLKKILLSEIENLKFYDLESIDIAKEKFKKGKIDAVIVFPEDINESVYIKLSGVPVDTPAEISLFIDKTDTTKSSIIIGALESSIIKISQSFGIEPAFLYSEKSFYEKKLTTYDYFAAAIVGFSIFALSLIFSISLISYEKANQVFESIISSSMSNFEILTGYFIAYTLINIIQILILIFAYILFFKGMLSISILYIFILMFLSSCSGSLLGICLSCILKSTIRTFQVSIIIILISLLISGVFWPSSSLPVSGKVLSYIFPTSFAIQAIEAIVVKNHNFTEVLNYTLVLLAFCIFYYILSLFLIRKAIE